MGSGLFMMLVTNHIIACCWFGVGSFQQGGRSWIDEMQLDTTDFSESYAASLHWSLTQFTPATNNIAPVSGLERWDSCPASHAFLYDVILYINLVYTWYLYVIIYLYIYIYLRICVL